MASMETTNQTLRKAALIAGIALVLMSALAGFSNFAVLDSLVTKGDAAKTAENILASEGLFRLGTLGWVLIAVLDMIVAWALLVFFNPVHKRLSMIAAWFRAGYAVILIVAVSQLVSAIQLLRNADYLKAFSTEQLHAEAMLKIDAFYTIWDIGLIFFGIHLLLLGYLAYKSTYVPKLLGVLLVIAGVGYVADSFGVVLTADTLFKVTMVTFVGEVVLFIWLLIKGRRVTVTR